MKSQNNGAQQVTRKTIISAAAAATLGMMSNGVQAVHVGDGRANLMGNPQYLQTGSTIRLKETPEGGPDSISMSSTDDMFAFSQIVAGGQNPMAVATALERDLALAPKMGSSALDDDQAVAAYAEFMTNGGGEPGDPASIAAELQKKAAEQKASKELKALEGNDSTSAFACLVESQAIESKAEAFKGSAPEEQDEDPAAAALPQKTAAQSKALVMKKILASKLKPKVLAKKAPRPPKQDISLLDQKQEVLLSDPMVGAKQSKLQGVIDQLRAGKTVEEVRDGQKALAQGGVSAPAPAAIRAAPAAPAQKKTFSLAIPSKGDDGTPEAAPQVAAQAEDPNVDAQADEIIAQIKDAAANLKTADLDGDAGTQTAALRALASSQFVQLSSEINIENDPNADIALGYLASQFPEEYPEEKVVTKEKPLSDDEKLQLRKKEMVDESAAILSRAVDSDSEMQQRVDTQEDAAKSAFEIAGMAQPQQEKPQQHSKDKYQPEAITLTLAQVSSDVDAKHKQKSDTLSDLGLTEQQLAIIDQYTSINENELNNQASNSNLIDKSGLDVGLGNALKMVPALDSLADLTSDSDNMKSYSESVAQAADVVSKESEAAAEGGLDTSSLTELKMQAREAAKLDASTRSTRPPTLLEKYAPPPTVQAAADSKVQDLAKKVDDKMQADLEAKAAIVAQAEAANSAAIDPPTGPTAAQKQTVAQPIDASKQLPQTTLDSTEQQEKLKQQQKLQFDADKQSALDQGYTAEQAEQYANQEAFTAAQQQQNVDASKSPALQDTSRPATGPLLTPPTQVGENQAGAMKTAEPAQAAQAPAAGDESSISLQAQIDKAQKQQDELKAAVAQRKQQLETGGAAAGTAAAAQAAPQTSQTQAQPDQATAQSQETQQDTIQQQASQGSGSSSISRNEERRQHLQKEAEAQANKEAQEIYEQQMRDSNQQSAVANTAQAADIQPIVAQKAAETPSQNPIQTPIVKAQAQAVLNPTQDALVPLQATPITASKKNILEVPQEQAPIDTAQDQVPMALQAKVAAAVQQQAPAPIQEQAPLVVQQATTPAPEQAQAATIAQAPAATVQEQVPAVAAQEQAPLLPAQEQAPAAVPQVVQEQEAVAAPPQAATEVPQQRGLAPIAYALPSPAQLQDASPSIGSLQQQKKVLQSPLKKVMPAPINALPKQAVATQKPALKTAVKKGPMKIQASLQKKLAQPIKQVQKQHALPSKTQAAPKNIAPKLLAPQKQELNTKLAKKGGPIKNIQNSPTAKVLKKADNVEKETSTQENAQNLNKEPISKLPKAKSAKHDAKIQNLQEKADIHQDDGSQLQGVSQERLLVDKKNAKQYEKDLNKARTEVQRAQAEMKGIDSEVSNFHQKMAKSMHSLLQAFSDGFEAMDQAKADEGEETQVIQIQKNEDKKAGAKAKELEKGTSGSHVDREERDKERYQKLDKIHSSISNLSDLTAKLKMSFSDDQTPGTGQKQSADQEHIQTKQDIQTQEPNTLEDKKQKQAVVTNAQKSAVKAQPSLKGSKQLAQTKAMTKVTQKKSIVQKKLNTISTNQKAASLAKVLPKVSHVKDQANNNKKVIALNKNKQPAVGKAAVVKPLVGKLKPSLVQLKTTGKQKIAITKQGKALVAHKLATTASTKANLKAKMKALLTASAKKKAAKALPGHARAVTTKLPQLRAITPKKINNHPLAAAQLKHKLGKPLMLAQTGSGADEEEQAAQGLQALSSMQQLFSSTSKQLQGISFALGKGTAGAHQIGSVAQSLGVKMDEKTKQEAAKLGSNQMIAHAMADRIMAQLDAGKGKADVAKDLTRTKEALVLAQKAFYEKDPEAIEYLQLDETEAANSNDKVYIYSENGSGSDEQVDDSAVQLQESDSDQIGNGPQENEDEVQAMLAADEHTEELSKQD